MKESQELILGSSAIRTINVPPPERELTIKDLLNLLARRRATVLGTLVFFVSLASLVCVFSTRRYSASAEIQVQKEQSSQLGLDNPASDETSFTDSLQDNVTLQTQAGILESDSLALKVIHDLNLASTKDFQPSFNPIAWAMSLFSPDGPSDAQLGPPTESDMGFSPRERLEVLSVFSKYLRVKPVAGTRLIDISFLSSDPQIAAEVVNRLTQALSDYNFETRHNATARTAQYLTSQLADLRKQSEALQAQVALAQRESGIVSLGGVDATGREQVYSTVLDKLQQATTAYTQAQSNRIAKDAVYEAAKTGDPEAISSLSGSTAFSSTSDSGLALIQSLRLQQATLKSQLAEASAKFGSAFPKLAEMQQQLETLNNSIKTEVARMAERAKNDSEMAHQIEQNTRGVYLNLKSQADAMNDKTIAYTIMRQEADQSRTLYETLFKQLKEAGVLADFRVSNISVVDPARVPAKPAKPNVPLYLAGALVGGLFLGCCGALMRDSMDNKIQDLPELEAQLGQMPLGILPFYKESHAALGSSTEKQPIPSRATPSSLEGEPPLFVPAASGPELLPRNPAIRRRSRDKAASIPALDEPRSAYVEALRALRTSLLLSRGGSPPKVILVTSSLAAEGKSMLSLNLATLLAQQGKNVLLVDADLRRPMVHHILQLSKKDGLSSYLAGSNPGENAIAPMLPIQDVPGLHVLPAGPLPPFPAELLGSEQMRNALLAWREQFDFVVIDGSPVLPVTDSVLLSAMADFTLLIARYKVTQRQSLDRSYRLLQSQTGDQKIGVVLNAISRTASTYYQYYGYSDSAYYGSKEGKSA